MRTVVGLGLAMVSSGCTERVLELRLSEDTDGDVMEDPGDQCGDDLPCGEGLVCFEGTCVGEGQLRISLSWEVRSDFDLHVRTPSGAEVDYETPKAGGGELDVDDCVGGMCEQPGGTHVENVVFETAPSGHYDVWVVNFDGLREGDFAIEVAGAYQARWSGTIGRPPYDTSELFDFDL